MTEDELNTYLDNEIKAHVKWTREGVRKKDEEYKSIKAIFARVMKHALSKKQELEDEYRKKLKDLETREEEIGCILNDKLSEDTRLDLLSKEYLKKNLKAVYWTTSLHNCGYAHLYGTEVGEQENTSDFGFVHNWISQRCDVLEGDAVGFFVVSKDKEIPDTLYPKKLYGANGA